LNIETLQAIFSTSLNLSKRSEAVERNEATKCLFPTVQICLLLHGKLGALKV